MKSLVSSARPPHAVAIFGEKGSGKRIFALHYAMTILCKNSSDPCFSCSSCKKAIGFNHPDITYIRGNDKTGSISVADIRNLRAEAYKIPHESEKRIFIIEEASNLTTEAQNAFLKILEEPPKTAQFILTCSNEEELLETVKSRITPIYLPLLSDDDKKKVFTLVLDDEFDEDINFLTGCFSTVGKSIACVGDEKQKAVFKDSIKLSELIRRKNRYEMLVLMASYGQTSDREKFKQLLRFTHSACLYICKNEKDYKKQDLAKSQRALCNALSFVENNVNSLAVIASLSGEICS